MQSNSAVAVDNNKAELGQYNLLTGQLEPFRNEEIIPETGWLFDPDFRMVLPDDVAGRQVIVDEGLALAFPASYQAIRKPPVRSDGIARSFGTTASTNGDRQLYVAQAEDAAQLVLSGFGMYLGKKSERLQVKLAGKAVYEFPFFRINE